MSRCVWKTGLVLLTVAALAATGLADTRWAIVTKPEPEILPGGELAVVGGATAPEGVHLALTELTLDNPVEVTLVPVEEGTELELLVFKENPQQPLLQGTTADGPLTYRFRTAGDMDFLVRAPEGAQYQFAAWVGPKFKLGAPPSLVSMAEFLGEPGGEASAAVGTQAGGTAATTTPAAAANPMMKWILVLLALILVALVVIAVLLLRRQKGKVGAAILLLALSGVALQAQDPRDASRLEPGVVPKKNWKGEVSRRWHEIRQVLDKIKKGGGTDINFKPGKDFEIKFDPMKELEKFKVAMALLEQFGVIDPREKFVQAEYNPPGMPPLPSRCYGTRGCGECFDQANGQLQAARRHLENNYVAYRQTMLEVERLTELADAAAGLSPIAKLKWTIDKANPNDPVNKSKAEFFKKYDNGQGNGIKGLNEALIAMGQCENQYFGDPNWYARYGMPYYMFMRERYLRRQ